MPPPSNDNSRARIRQFGKRFFSGMAIVSVIAFAMYLLTRHHIIFPLEVLGEDLVFGGSPEKIVSDDKKPGVTLVEITEEDYGCPALFDGKSPLRRDLVYQLINKVAHPSDRAGEPTAVVVDIDLSGSWQRPPPATYKAGDLACSNGKSFPFTGLPPLNVASDKLTFVEPTRIVRGPQGKSIPVLADSGFSLKLANNGEARGAVSLFPYDWDHKARSFLKQVEVRKGTTGEDLMKCESLPTLAAVADKGGLPSVGGWKDCEETSEEDRYFINFTKSRIDHRYTASEVLTEKDISFHNDIVVIGGSYNAGRDSYFTPIGPLAGMELVGLSINAVQNDKAIGETKELMAFVVDLLIGAVLVLLDISGLGVIGTVLTLAAVVVLPLASSLLIFQTANLFLNFMPIVLGAGAHMIYDRHKEVKELNESLEHKLTVAMSEAEGLQERVNHLKRQRHDLRLRNEELRQSGMTANFNISIERPRRGDER